LKRVLLLVLLIGNLPLYARTKHPKQEHKYVLPAEARAAQQRAKATKRAQKQFLKNARGQRQTID